MNTTEETNHVIPTVYQVLHDPCVRYFAKDVLQVALTKDLVDAINDLELVLAVLKARQENPQH